MIRKSTLVIWVLMFTSCATIKHQKQYDVFVHTNLESSKLVYNDSLYNLPDSITILRSNKNLQLTLLNDSVSREYIIKSSPNREFLFYNLFWVYAAPFAYAIDFTTPKRFSYGKEIFLDAYDTTNMIIPVLRSELTDYFNLPYATAKNQVNLFITIPYINSFRMQPAGEPLKTNTGFWGISAGLEYYYKQNKYLSISAAALTDLFVPLPASPGFDYPYEMMKSVYAGFTDNIAFNRFTFGWGICYAYNRWELSDFIIIDDVSSEFYEIFKGHQSLGAIVNGYHRIWENGFIGLTYRPTFIKIRNPGEVSYEHLISFHAGWKFRLKE